MGQVFAGAALVWGSGVHRGEQPHALRSRGD